MRNTINTLILFFVFTTIYGQTKNMENIGKFYLRNSGEILSHENNVNGYYFFYSLDKLKKNQREYGIKILDNNLNEVAYKKYVAHKSTILLDSKFNNDALMFAFLNIKEKKINLVMYDEKAVQISKKTIELSKKEFQWLSIMNTEENSNVLFSVPNKGFLYNKIQYNKKVGYSLKFYPSNGKRGWSYNSPPNSKEFLFITPIEVNEKYIVLLEMSKPGMLSKKITIKTKILNSDTGKLILEKAHDPKKPKLITNAFLTKDENLVILGEYFNENDKIFTSKSLGLFTEIININGETISENFSSWEDNLSSKLKSIDEKDNYYVYFHDIIQTKNGNFYAIGEKYKRTASAGGITRAVLSKGQNTTTQLTITDALIFEFDSDFKIKNINIFKKGTSRVPSLTDFGSPQLNAHALATLGAFDYEYTQIDKKNDRFYTCFIDYERLKGEKNKNAFKTIIYDEDEFSEDKIYLESGKGVSIRVLPAKIGHVLLLEYNKKEKSIKLHLEKLNIK